MISKQCTSINKCNPFFFKILKQIIPFINIYIEIVILPVSKDCRAWTFLTPPCLGKYLWILVWKEQEMQDMNFLFLQTS